MSEQPLMPHTAPAKAFAGPPAVLPARQHYWLMSPTQQEEVESFLRGVLPLKRCSTVAVNYLEKHHKGLL